jgi:hypothetical protein
MISPENLGLPLQSGLGFIYTENGAVFQKPKIEASRWASERLQFYLEPFDLLRAGF